MTSSGADPRPLLRTERLHLLVEVARHEGFSRAARALGRTQSAVSQAILLLEREVGAPLFVREGRRARLTEPGRVLVAHAERVLAELQRARAELDALSDLTCGRLVLGTTDTIAMYVLPPVLSALRAQHPGVELTLDLRPSPALAERVVEGAVDVAVASLPLPSGLRLRGRPAESELRVEALIALRDVLVCRAAHPLAKRRGVRASDLRAEPLLLLDRSTGSRAHLDAWLRDRGVEPSVAMEASSVEVLLRLAELGFGVTVVPEVAVPQRRALASLALTGLPRRRLGLLTPTVGPLSPASRAFVRLLREGLDAAG